MILDCSFKMSHCTLKVFAEIYSILIVQFAFRIASVTASEEYVEEFYEKYKDLVKYR